MEPSGPPVISRRAAYASTWKARSMMITRTSSLAVWIAAVILSGGACAPSLRGQQTHPAPDAHECRVLANKLASDPHSAAFREALRSNIAAWIRRKPIR